MRTYDHEQRDAELRRVLGANEHESTLEAARRIVDELISWRSGCEAGFGIVTGSPHESLAKLGIDQRAHHHEHHIRERTAWSCALGLAVRCEARDSERLAREGLAALDEQGLPL